MPQTAADLLVPLNLFSPSPTNPRSRISTAGTALLAESIATHQLMLPILARPIPGALPGQPLYEIVAGHRRWTACGQLAAAGRSPHGDAIPALVRKDLTDAQVLAMQLVENIHREDLHPLDEAEHYRRMREDPAAPASVEDIAHVGKVSESRVYERLSLLHLVPAAREAFQAEKLSLKTALQVARMPPALQAEVTTHLADWGGEPMAPKAAAAFIHTRYMLRLAHAPFDPTDASLMPDAGACGACPKRTGANPQLFGDINDGDTCTDTSCFAAKKAAQHARLVDELRVSGFTIVDGDGAREACTADGRALKPGLHALEAMVPYELGNTELKIVDVLTRAEAPNEHTKVVDHPGNALVMYAVATPDLEQHLRKIKAHRSQINNAVQRVAQRNAKPAPAADPAAPAGPAAAHVSAPAAQQNESAAAAIDATAHDQLVQDLLAFKPPPTVAGKYGGLTLNQYTDKQRLRAEGIVAAAAVATCLRQDKSEGMPPTKLPQMILVLLMWGDSFVPLEDLCTLCGVDSMPTGERRYRLEAQCEWAWALPDHDAELIATTWLAAQEHDGKSHFRFFAQAACEGLNLPFAAIQATAAASVDEQLRLGALANGEDKKPGGKTKSAVGYRDPETGAAWTGRGRMPTWLKARITAGGELSTYAVSAGSSTNATANGATT